MPKILFIGKTSRLNNAYSLNLNVQLGINVIFKTRLKDVYDYLKRDPESIKLIVIAPMTNDKNTSLDMYRFLVNNENPIPILSLEANEIAKNVMKVLPPGTNIQEIVSEVGNLLYITPGGDSGEVQVPEYYAVPIKYYYFIDEIVCNTFLRIKKDNAPDHYVMRFRKGDIYSRRDIQLFFEKGINYFYVRYDDRLFFVNDVTDMIMDRLNDESADDIEKMRLVENCRDVISGLLLTRGMTEDTVLLAKHSIKKVVALAQSWPKIGDLFHNLMKSKTSYRYRRTQLVTYITFHIISNMEWGSTEQQDKLAFVSFFHDITLLSDKLAMIDSEKDLTDAMLSMENERIVLNHAREASELVMDFPRAPLGAETIIARHHGTLGGTGFAKNFSNNLEPLTVVFIVAERYANYLLQFHGTLTNSEMIKKLFENFTKSQYKRVIRTLTNFEF